MTATKINALLYLLLLYCSCSPCREVTLESVRWKNQWGIQFMDAYTKYRRETQQSTCVGDKRDIYLDFARKAYSMHGYPAIEVFKSIRQYVKSNKIDFDTLLMFHIWHPDMETMETSCPETFFVLKVGDQSKVIKISLDFCETVYAITEIPKDHFFIHDLVTKKFKDGCDLGYISYTFFDKRWHWSIKKILVNPDGTHPRVFPD